MSNNQIEFKELPIKSDQNPLFRVFYVVENRRSQVIEGFREMTTDKMDETKDLIIKMATVKNFKSNKIRWRMKNKYTYGELKPKGHRFFFFLKFRNSIIFFRYSKKKSDTLKDKFYSKTESLKRRYESEFEKRIQGR